jgi:hypothetical protein
VTRFVPTEGSGGGRVGGGRRGVEGGGGESPPVSPDGVAHVRAVGVGDSMKFGSKL